MSDKSITTRYAEGWESLSTDLPSVSAPDVSRVSQQPGLPARLAQLLSRGVLVGVPMVFALSMMSFLFSPVLTVFPSEAAMLGWTISMMVSVLFAGLAIRFWWSVVDPEVQTGVSSAVSLLYLLAISFLTLGLQTGTGYYAAFAYSGQDGRVDRSLLAIDSLSLGLHSLTSWQFAVLGFCCGVLGLQLTRSFLGKYAPWQRRERVPTWSRVALVVCLLAVGASIGKLVYDLQSLPDIAPLTQSEYRQVVDRKAERRRFLEAAWQPGRAYEGPLDSLLSNLSKREALGDDGAQRLAEKLAAGALSPNATPLDIWVGSWWLDEKLGYDHRTASHNRLFEQKLVPANLELWNRIAKNQGADALWDIRHTGTLFALENLLSEQEVPAETLHTLKDELATLELTANDLKAQLQTRIVNADGSTDTFLLGEIRSPHAALDHKLAVRGFSAVNDWSNDVRQADPLLLIDAIAEKLAGLTRTERNFQKLTLELVPVFGKSDLESLAGLPARLRMAAVAVEMRLYKLEKGKNPATLSELSGVETSQITLEGRVLKTDGPNRDWEIVLPE